MLLLPVSKTLPRIRLPFHISLRAIWLLTLSDFDAFVCRQTLFGIFGALSGPILTTNSSPDLLTVLYRLPQVFLWV